MLFLIIGELLKFNAEALTIAKILFFNNDFVCLNDVSAKFFSLNILLELVILMSNSSFENELCRGNNNEKEIIKNLNG